MLALATNFGLAAAFATFAIGVVALSSSSAPLRRVVGAALMFVGAIAAAAMLGGREADLVVGAALLFAWVSLGAAIAVRIVEEFGGAGARDLNRIDADRETTEVQSASGD